MSVMSIVTRNCSPREAVSNGPLQFLYSSSAATNFLFMSSSRVISGFRRGVNENFVLIGRYAALIEELPTFRDNLPGPSSRVK
jgi:hypothetical protein